MLKRLVVVVAVAVLVLVVGERRGGREGEEEEGGGGVNALPFPFSLVLILQNTSVKSHLLYFI